MTTYAEKIGEAPFDWNVFLAKKKITRREWDFAEVLAAKWTTCACGNQCDAIPRHKNGTPKDNILLTYGTFFLHAIRDKNIKEAKDHLIIIETRSSQILRDLNTATS